MIKEDYFKKKIDDIISSNPDKKDELMEELIRLAPEDGLILEFGVATGSSINRISKATQKIVYGFDSFDGLPEDWGTFASKSSFKCSIPTVNENVELVIGLFDQVLDDFLQKHSEPVSFCHIDSDIYSSAKYVLDKLSPRFRRGTILLFDELANYSEYENHEYKAFIEFLANNDGGYDIEFMGRRHTEGYGFRLV